MSFKIKQFLECQLSEFEILERGQELALKEQELQGQKDELKATQTAMKEGIKSTETVIQKLSKDIINKTEEREVECEWVMHSPVKGMKQFIRLDTQEVIDEYDMTDRDKERFQLSLQQQMDLN